MIRVGYGVPEEGQDFVAHVLGKRGEPLIVIERLPKRAKVIRKRRDAPGRKAATNRRLLPLLEDLNVADEGRVIPSEVINVVLRLVAEVIPAILLKNDCG